MHPDGDPGWDGPLGIQVPDDARELDRDLLAYRREQRALRRRAILRRMRPVSPAGLVPLLASVFAVCLVAGMLLSVFTISPAGDPVRSPSPAAGTSTSGPAATPSPASSGTSPAAAGRAAENGGQTGPASGAAGGTSSTARGASGTASGTSTASGTTGAAGRASGAPSGTSSR